MPTVLRCPGCKATIRANAAAAGRTLPCPGCKTPIAVPRSTIAPKDDDVYTDVEVVGHVADHLDEVVPLADDEGLDQLDVVEEDVEPLEEVEDAEPAAGADLGWSRLLRLNLIHVRGHQGSFVDSITRQDNAGYDLCDPQERTKVGIAEEVRDAGQEALRFLVGRHLMNARVEVREGRDEELLATLRRPPYLFGASLEILGPDDEVLGVFERGPWASLTNKPIWITSRNGKKLLKIQPRFLTGRCTLAMANGREVGELLTESAYEKRTKIYWFARGMSYYIRFGRALDGRPTEKLLFLCAALGMDLLLMESVTDH